MLLLLLYVDEMYQINRSVPSIDFENHELTGLAAHDDQAAGNGLVHLDDASDIILAV